MKITALKLENVRVFSGTNKLDFSEQINIFVGPNNSGKSTILKSLYLVQNPNALTVNDKTIGTTNSSVEIFISGTHPHLTDTFTYEKIILSLTTKLRNIKVVNGGERSFKNFPESEPDNLIYTHLSKRKVNSYNQTISEAAAYSAIGSLSNLPSKIDRLIDRNFQPANSLYEESCNNILGFVVSTTIKGNGKEPVYNVYNFEQIPLYSMGEGVPSILGLIVDMCVAENKIFIIEEPENDLHPKALKSLLKLITESSKNNQFFISTHSNIVLKYLGAQESSKIFSITSQMGVGNRTKMFKSEVKVIQDEISRREVLEDLGYDLFDFNLWKGWLILEESSAEVLIRDYFISWFVPSLKAKIRTFSANSTSKIESKFEDFNRLFVFLHLEPTYKNKVWVLIDGGEEETVIINKMKEMYTKSGWKEENFNQFQEHDFEKYYPARFKDEVDRILAITDKKTKREEKKQLLNQVKDWMETNKDTAIEEFKQSAAEVIAKLKQISKEL